MTTSEMTTKKAYFIFLVFFITALFITGNNDKVSAAMVLLMSDLKIGAAAAGALITVASVVGGIAAVPIGAAMVKTGPRIMGIVAILLALIGCLIGALLPHFTPLVVSRIFDGAAMGVIAVVVPTVIADNFREEKRGLPMGIWSCWVSIGYIMVLQGTALLGSEAHPHTWVNVWWALAGAFIIILVLFSFLSRGTVSAHAAEETTTDPKPSVKAGFQSVSTILIMFCMLFLAVIVALASCFMPAYCNAVLQYDIAKANSLTSLMSLSMLVSGLLMGFILNKTRKHLTVFLICAILTAMLGLFSFLFPANIAPVYLILLGFFPQAMYATLFTVAPDAAHSPATVSVTMGMISFGQLMAGLAVTFGGAVIDTWGFAVCSYALGIVGVLLVLCAIFFNISMKQKRQKITA